MWVVHDALFDEAHVFNDYYTALKLYEKYKDELNDHVSEVGHFEGYENIYLSKVYKHYYSYETDEKEVIENEYGEDTETGFNIWDFKEENRGYKDVELLHEVKAVLDSPLTNFDDLHDSIQSIVDKFYDTKYLR